MSRPAEESRDARLEPLRGMEVLAESKSYLESRVISICCAVKTSMAMGAAKGLQFPSITFLLKIFPGNETIQNPRGAGPISGKHGNRWALSTREGTVGHALVCCPGPALKTKPPCGLCGASELSILPTLLHLHLLSTSLC